FCPFASRVTSLAWPDDAGTRDNGVTPPRENRMDPSEPQVPCATLDGTAARTCGWAPPRSIRFNLKSAKKPSDRLSGDQNGQLAPSVPGNAWADIESNSRTHSRMAPSS